MYPEEFQDFAVNLIHLCHLLHLLQNNKLSIFCCCVTGSEFNLYLRCAFSSNKVNLIFCAFVLPKLTLSYNLMTVLLAMYLCICIFVCICVFLYFFCQSPGVSDTSPRVAGQGKQRLRQRRERHRFRSSARSKTKQPAAFIGCVLHQVKG